MILIGTPDHLTLQTYLRYIALLAIISKYDHAAAFVVNVDLLQILSDLFGSWTTQNKMTLGSFGEGINGDLTLLFHFHSSLRQKTKFGIMLVP